MRTTSRMRGDWRMDRAQAGALRRPGALPHPGERRLGSRHEGRRLLGPGAAPRFLKPSRAPRTNGERRLIRAPYHINDPAFAQLAVAQFRDAMAANEQRKKAVTRKQGHERRVFFHQPARRRRFRFDWGRLAVTVGPGVKGAKKFSGGAVERTSGARPFSPQPSRRRRDYLRDLRFRRTNGRRRRRQARGSKHRAGLHGLRARKPLPFDPQHRWCPMLLFVVYARAGPEEALRELPDFQFLKRP